MKRFAGRLSQHTYTIFIQTLHKYRWITAVGLAIKSTKHLVSTLFSWSSSCFYDAFFRLNLAVCCSSGRSAAATRLQTSQTGAVKKSNVHRFQPRGPDSHVGPRLSARLVGRSSSLNDRDYPLVSVCVVSRWLGQRFFFFFFASRVGRRGWGGADAARARSDARRVCPLAVSGNGPATVACSRSFIQENLAVEFRERRDPHDPAHLRHSHIPQPGHPLRIFDYCFRLLKPGDS